MTAMRAAILSFLMLSAIMVSGIGVYTAGATNGYTPANGYGIGSGVR